VLRMVRRAVPVALLLALTAHGTAFAATVDISIVSSPTPGAYNPSTATLQPGDTARWTNTTTLQHSATGDGPLNFWDTGTFGNGQNRSKVFAVGGVYAYHCSVHSSMHGTVKVTPTRSPASGTTSTVFTITWGSGSIPAGYEADVIIMRPGQNWVAWRVRQTGTNVSSTFTPDAGTGQYLFASRIRKANQATPASGWAGTGIQVN
jgi:plastocyanin